MIALSQAQIPSKATSGKRYEKRQNDVQYVLYFLGKFAAEDIDPHMAVEQFGIAVPHDKVYTEDKGRKLQPPDRRCVEKITPDNFVAHQHHQDHHQQRRYFALPLDNFVDYLREPLHSPLLFLPCLPDPHAHP